MFGLAAFDVYPVISAAVPCCGSRAADAVGRGISAVGIAFEYVLCEVFDADLSGHCLLIPVSHEKGICSRRAAVIVAERCEDCRFQRFEIGTVLSLENSAAYLEIAPEAEVGVIVEDEVVVVKYACILIHSCPVYLFQLGLHAVVGIKSEGHFYGVELS